MLLLIAATVASYLVGWVLGSALLLPMLNTAPAWWLMAREIRRRQVHRAIAVMLVWAGTMAVCATVMAAMGWSRGAGGELFLWADYRQEMLQWVRTGVGPESEPAVFVPRHLAYAGTFALAAIATGGVLAMPMGAVLMNSMGDYVGTMAAGSAHPVASALLGWHPWAVLRIVAFVILGVVLSGPLICRVGRAEWAGLHAYRRWVGVACALLVGDIALKAVLAPAWGRLLRGLAGW